MISDIPITKDTEVSLVFVNSSAAWYNTVGYYTYPTSEIPTIENIKRILAFPNASPIYKTAGVGALVCGDEVKTKITGMKTRENLKTNFLRASLLAGICKVWDSEAHLQTEIHKAIS